MTADTSDVTLLILAHGSTLNDGSERAALEHAATLSRTAGFADVRACFWKQEPRVLAVLDAVRTPRAVIVPFFTGAGYFVDELIPEAMGLKDQAEAAFVRVRNRSGVTCYYAEPVGTHPRMTEVLLERAREAVRRAPFPRCPPPGQTTLVVAGHGTERSPVSRLAVERQVAAIRALEIYAEVRPAFLEEEPRIADCLAVATSPCVVVVPFFLSDGLHVVEDIPVLLGEPREQVEARKLRGQATWRNPTGRAGRLVWYATAVGSDPSVAGLILARAREALAWGTPASP